MHYSFEIAENMAGNEGSVEGYFAVQQEIAGLGMAIVDCQISLEDVNPEANIIPVILDEFGSDLMLSRILAQPYDVTRLASIASFGFDRDHQNYRIAHSSHFAHHMPRNWQTETELPSSAANTAHYRATQSMVR
jgi:hypothetical protein